MSFSIDCVPSRTVRDQSATCGIGVLYCAYNGFWHRSGGIKALAEIQHTDMHKLKAAPSKRFAGVRAEASTARHS